MEAKAAGSDIESVELRLHRLVDQEVEVIFPAGTFFAATSSPVQNMVATEEMTVVLSDDDWSGVFVPAACASMRRRQIPGSGDSFHIKSSSSSSKLEKIVPLEDRYNGRAGPTRAT